MSDKIIKFRSDLLNASTWDQRRDGIPLELLDDLTKSELDIVEKELINALSLKDDWPTKGLGYIKSNKALSKLYQLLSKSKKGMKVTIAHSIFQICNDEEMLNIVLNEVPRISNQYELIDMVYLLADFEDNRIKALLNKYREHWEYLVAYNATKAMGLPTKDIVDRFKEKDRVENENSLINKLFKKFNTILQRTPFGRS